MHSWQVAAMMQAAVVTAASLVRARLASAACQAPHQQAAIALIALNSSTTAPARLKLASIAAARPGVPPSLPQYLHLL